MSPHEKRLTLRCRAVLRRDSLQIGAAQPHSGRLDWDRPLQRRGRDLTPLWQILHSWDLGQRLQRASSFSGVEAVAWCKIPAS